MVVIGGITRLTESGLSMVDWKLFMGMVPPLSEQDWLETFNQYKQFPEYQEVNFMFTLEEFKSIFFWEYLHRLIPFVYFLLTKKITGKLSRQSIVILFMGAFQGFLGWWMVKSGLIDNPDVSHYRLAAHLIAAFLTFAYTFWVALSLIYKDEERPNVPFMRKWIMVLFAGLNAGFVMNTYPKMGDSWIAESVTAMEPFWINFIDGIGGVQFVHRTLAHIVVGLVLFLLLRSSKFEMNKIQTNSLITLLVIVFAQFMLGVFTLLYAVPVWLGVTHQVGAFFLLGTVVYALSSFRKV